MLRSSRRCERFVEGRLTTLSRDCTQTNSEKMESCFRTIVRENLRVKARRDIALLSHCLGFQRYYCSLELKILGDFYHNARWIVKYYFCTKRLHENLKLNKVFYNM